MSYFKNKTVFITGASSGIGAELARQLFAQEANLFLFARRSDRLKDLATELSPQGQRVGWAQGDVTNGSQVEEAVRTCLGQFGRINIVIANAGFGVAGNVSQLKIEDYRRQFETNVFGVLSTVYATEKALEESQGQLVLLGSVAGYVPLPGNSAYTMSKFSIRALAKALQYEWKEKGISVTHLAPGFVDSDIRKTDNLGNLKEGHPDPIPDWIRVSTPVAVREMIKAIRNRQAERVITGHGKIIQGFNQYFPRLIPWIIGTLGLRSRPEPK
ncbi:MAG: SDR family NAD(P)-dependent oxidoreductase [Proteobacteria bacterium]|nr:SDR family NAD(P)-dependent oxidoreductase [Pseudomonadota bacterium]